MGYLEAMGNYQITEAENYATTETINNTLHFIEQSIMPNLDSSYIVKNTPASFEINDIRLIDDSTAEVLYTKTTPIQVLEGKLTMVKENQEWKAKVIINIPQFMNASMTIDSVRAKEMEDKYKGKLKVGQSDSVPRSKFRK